jgi:hypothetical protein
MGTEMYVKILISEFENTVSNHVSMPYVRLEVLTCLTMKSTLFESPEYEGDMVFRNFG